MHGIHLFSSGYTLYGDLSRRVMTTLEALAPRVDVYSIDRRIAGRKPFGFSGGIARS